MTQSRADRPRYAAVQAGLVRASSRTTEPGVRPWPDLHVRSGQDQGRIVTWLHELWADEDFVEAVELASPTVAAAARRIGDGSHLRPARLRRLAESTAAYALRSTTRSAPFGMFAGTAPVTVAAHTRASIGRAHRGIARPDELWLAAVVTSLEADPATLRQLTVQVNNTVFTRGDRLIVPGRPHTQPDDGTSRVRAVEIRHSHAVAATLTLAASPIRCGDLIEKLAAEFPGIADAVIAGMAGELVAAGVLLTGLRPPGPVTDPLGHVLAQLNTIPVTAESARIRAGLADVRQHLDSYADLDTPRARRAVAARARSRMWELAADPEPRLAIDQRLDASVELPPLVTAEAETAAAALVRLSPYPYGNPAWQAWHADFLERYGPDALIPVSEVVDPHRGLGYPAGYRGSPRSLPPRPYTERDRLLLRMAQHAVLDGGDLDVDDAVINGLSPQMDERPVQPAPHTELRFSLHAASPTAVDRGEFTLVVASTARQAGTTTGRFLYLLDHDHRQRLSEALADLPTITEGAVIAQLSSPPLSGRLQGLARTPPVAPLIYLGETPPEGSGERIDLANLAVTADSRRLQLVDLRTGRVVEPVLPNAVELRHRTYPLARFLCELTTARAAACVPFDWGAAADLPSLPRVRYGRRIVLAPARWNLTADDLPGRQATMSTWETALNALRERYRVPSAVHLGEHDQRIGLDLDQPAHRRLLRNHLDRAGTASLTEAQNTARRGWIDGRAHEITLPMVSTTPPAPAASRWPVHLRDRPAHPPGDRRWLSARLYAQPEQQTEILTAHLPSLQQHWPGRPAGGWFLRHHEGGHHLRLRLPQGCDDDSLDRSLSRLGRWAEQLHTVGLAQALTLDSYHPETGRYGDGPALAAAEAVFAADSAAVIHQLQHDPGPALVPDPDRSLALTAASLIDIAAASTGALADGMAWLVDHLPQRSGPPLPQTTRHRVLGWADPDHREARSPDGTGAAQVYAAWEQRRAAIVAYRQTLLEYGGPDPDGVLSSLLHLHQARMVGIDPEPERACLRLARAAALSWLAQHDASAGSRS